MLLSVLIPTYNCACMGLVKDLSAQLPLDAEIIVGDDGSTDQETLKVNAQIDNIPQCRFWQSPTNLGRPAIRNRLAEMAQGEWLIFMDSDAAIAHKDYLQRYLNQRDSDVVYGGTALPVSCPSKNVTLRYHYEKEYWEKHGASIRQRAPYNCFTTFNFMIHRDTFLAIKFDEHCTGYGHEDTLFGLTLKQKGINICHIDNPLIHTGLEPNEVYLRKVEQSLESLRAQASTLLPTSSLLQFHSKVRRWHILPLVKLWHSIFGGWEKSQLCSAKPSLTVLNLYKLGFYCTL